MMAAAKVTMKNTDSCSTDCQKDVTMMEIPSKEDDAGKSQENEKLCPLFMEGLPSDFTSNPALAAIASLLEEDDDDATPKKKEYETPSTRVGGGKIRRTPARARRKEGRPYNNKKQKDDKKADVSVGEANLFLKMWKL